MASYAASFNCAKASSYVEKTVCSDDKLSKMDETLSQLYNEVKQLKENSKKIQITQRIWLKERNKCNSKFINDYAKSKCIYASYEARINDLKDMKKPQNSIFEIEDKLTIKTSGVNRTTQDNKIIFSNFDYSTRNKYQIIEATTDNLKLKVLETTEGEREYVTQDKKFLIYKRKSIGSTKELTIKNKKTNKIVAKKRFSDDFIWGKIIDGNKFLGVQRNEILLFDLKSLKLLKKYKLDEADYSKNPAHIGYALSGSMWKNKIIIQNPRYLLILDKNLNKIKTINLIGKSRGKLIISEDKAIVLFDKNIKVFDLNTNKILFTVEKPAAFVSFCMISDFLMVAPGEENKSALNAHIYEITTGKIKATIPFIASNLAYKKGYLLAFKNKYRVNGTFTLFKVNLNKLKNTNIIDKQLKTSFDKALLLYKKTNNIYKPIEILEKAGIKEYSLDNNMSSQESKKVLRQYGIWLSQTLDKYSETENIFDTAKVDKTDKEVKTALALARVKECYLDPTCKADEKNLKKVFGVQKIPNKRIDIQMSSFDKLYFIDDKIYVSRYEVVRKSSYYYASRYENGLLATAIYDIDTLRHVKDIYFQPEEHEEYQDKITNIIDTKDNVVLKIVARWNTKRDNFAVISKKDFSLQCQGYTSVDLEKLAYENNNICECLNGKASCKNKESKLEKLNTMIKKRGIGLNRNEKVIGASDNYFITNTGWSEYKLNFYPLEKKNDKTPKKSMRHTKLHLLKGTDQIVYSNFNINSVMKNRVKFSLYNIETNTDKTLFYAERKANIKYPNSIVYKNLLIIGSGHDLFIYDVQKMKFVAYDVKFIEEEVITNEIDGLYIHKDKLFIITSNGRNSRVVDLKNLEKLK